jgi:hypothetical protein
LKSEKALSFSGGYQTKSLPVETHEFLGPNGSCTCVAVSKKTDWIQRMAGGDVNRAGAIMDVLKNQWKRALASGAAETTEDSPPTVDDDEHSVDPMDQCTDIVAVTPDPKRQRNSRDTPNNLSEV